jgi:hypothetical protein
VPPSALHARVYAEGGVILGPDVDPEGWKVYDPIKITGTLFGTREVSVQYTVSDPLTDCCHNTAEPRGHVLQLTIVTSMRLWHLFVISLL